MEGRCSQEGFLADTQLEPHSSAALQQAKPSFTSINTRPTKKLIIARSKSHLGGIDSDRLYELPRNSQPIVATPKKRKRAQETPKCLIPHLGTTNSYRNTSLSPVTSAEILNSRTATSPDSRKRLLEKTSHLDSERNRPFSAAVIAKPFLRPTSTHWATTEEAVKANRVEISITTLGRLAAFKFRASPRQQPPPLRRQSTLPRESANSCSNESVPLILEGNIKQSDSSDFDDGLEDEDFLDIDQDYNGSYAQSSTNDERSLPLFETKSILALDNGLLCPTEQQPPLSTAHSPVANEFSIDDEDEIKIMQLPNEELPEARTQLNDVLFSDDDPRKVYDDCRGHSGLSISQTRPTYCADEQTRAHSPNLFKESCAEHLPLPPFARPDFPARVPDRSPIIGISADIVLRTCFRIGEALRVGAMCDGLRQDAVIELFARVRVSFRVEGTTKQHLQFVDLFHDRAPFLEGVLGNYKVTQMQAYESAELLGDEGKGRMVRCLGRLKRGPQGWMFYIINIRPTSWEEIGWTKQIAGAGMLVSENGNLGRMST